MARMPGVPASEAGPFARLFFWLARRRMGKLAESWPIAAHSPPLLKGWAFFEAFADRAKRADPKLKRLAALKVSVMVGCPT